MAHFVKLDKNNVVVDVQVISDNDCMVNGVESDAKGQEFINNTLNLPGTWIRTSINTRHNQHYDPDTGELSADQSKAFRGNYAGIGMVYDSNRDVFTNTKPYASWIFNENISFYEPPIDRPSIKIYDDNGSERQYAIYWNEEITTWIAVDHLLNEYTWNTDTNTWS